MTAEEAKRNQDEISKHYKLSYWYGTKCNKCCGVYPKLMATNGHNEMCWYECEVCGTKVEPQSMPWIAEREWNAGHFVQKQISFF